MPAVMGDKKKPRAESHLESDGTAMLQACGIWRLETRIADDMEDIQ